MKSKTPNQPALDALRKASEGLLYPSETDAPFEAFSWGKANGELTPAKVVKLVGAPAAAPVEQQSLDEFFQYLTTSGASADKFQKLHQVIDEQLTGSGVFRLGTVEIDVYLVGATCDGEWVGLKTKAVET